MHKHFYIAERLTKLMDSQFSVGKFKFGLDPILGLVPFGGDTITLFISLYLVMIGISAGLPFFKIMQMIFYVLVDYLIGLIPFFGDIFDFGFKANTLNLNILRKHLEIGEEGVVL